MKKWYTQILAPDSLYEKNHAEQNAILFQIITKGNLSISLSHTFSPLSNGEAW